MLKSRLHFTKLLISGIAFAVLPASLFADDIAALSDEFDLSGNLSNWNRLYEVEGWGADQLETWDISTSRVGHMRLMPHTSSWFDNLKGVHVFKEVTGDFIVTAKVTILNRNQPMNPTARPGGSFSLSGIFVHAPRNIIGSPVPVPSGEPQWSGDTPVGFTTDWRPQTDNYVFLSFGRAGSFGPNTDDGVLHQCEIKTTRNGNSNLYFTQSGVPGVAEPRRNEVILQLIRLGDTVVVMRKHPGGDWIVENRYPNSQQPLPVWGEALQVGLTAYTDWEMCSQFHSRGVSGSFLHNYTVLESDFSFDNGATYTPNPDLISDVDYFRFQRPDPTLTEEMLESLSTAYNPVTRISNAANGVLPVTGAGMYLGDRANQPLRGYLASSFGSNITLPQADLTSDFDNDGKSTLLEYVLGTPAQTLDQMRPDVTSSLTGFEFPQNPDASAASIHIEVSEDLLDESWSGAALRPAGSYFWQELNGYSVSIDDLTNQVSIETATLSEGGRRFYRMRVAVE